MTLTATPDRVREADAIERNLIIAWSDYLRQGCSPALVASFITAAVDFEPLLGQPMAECQRPGCGLWVTEDARDQYGRLYCPDGCADDVASTDQEARDAAVVASPRPTLPEFQLRRF